MNNLKLLYVEDDIEALEDTSYLLSEFFSEVHTAQDGKEALEMYAKIMPDILVLDINLPKINGIDVALSVREKNLNIPILFITAFSDKDMLLKAIEISASGYIVKPYKISELRESINKIILKSFKKQQVLLEGGFLWDKSSKTLFLNDKHINLTLNELALLEFLCDNRSQFFKPSDIELALSNSGLESVKENNIVQLISRFRHKIHSRHNKETFFIENIYGLGYRILLKE